jgi:2-aminoadipate transaminase
MNKFNDRMMQMLELFNSVTLYKSSSTPLYIQLSDKIREMIVSGTLLPGFRLPSIRKFSSALNVNQVTVVNAFKHLESEGFIYSKPGSGSFVSDCFSSPPGSQSDSTHILDELYQQEDISVISSGQVRINENTVNFASATPTPDLFPVDGFKLALDEVLERDKGNAFGYQESQGFLPLRESMVKILCKSKLNCDAESVQIISGSQQGIDIISKTLLKQGGCVITESPTYRGAIAVFKSRDARIVDIEMHEDGPDLNTMEYSIKKYKPSFIYTIPSFQNPTGYSYSNDKRSELLKLADKYNTYIIEDDYVSDLDFEGRNYIPLKAIDRWDRVIFIKSFSKLFMPGLRLGFMLVPSRLQGSIIEAKHTSDISTSGLIQRAFDMYIRKGFWNKHFKFMYDTYKERYIKITESLDSHLPNGLSYLRPGGGLNIWVNVPYGFPVNSLLNHSSSNDIVFAPGRIFYSSSSGQKLNNIRLSFASVYTGQIPSGIQTLCSIIAMLQNKWQPQSNIPVL